MLDQEEALSFYTTHLGFELRDDIDLGFTRWLTVGVPGQDHSLLLELVGGPQHDPATATQVRELVTKGALEGLSSSDDVDATYTALRDAGVEMTQEPVQQPYGTTSGSVTRSATTSASASPKHDHLSNDAGGYRRNQRGDRRPRICRHGFSCGKCALVVVTVDRNNIFTTTIGVRGGRFLVSFNADTRKETGRGTGDEIEVELLVDPDR